MPPIDWQSMVVPTVNLLELVLRGSAVYLVLFFVLRIFRREAGALGTSDLLVIVLIADATQNAIAADYRSVPEAIVLVATIAGWNYGLDWLGYHYTWARRILQPKPLLLVEHGKAIRRNMRKELITMDDLEEQMREQGIEDLSEVASSHLEGDGHISFVKEDGRRLTGKPKRGPHKQ
jgi:uncharacterized membrane protein YcaP (DUF421 family)